MKKKEAKIVDETKNKKVSAKKERRSEESKKKSRKGLVFLSIVFLVLIILGGSFVWYTKIYKASDKNVDDNEVKKVSKNDKLKFVSYEKANASYNFLSDYILVSSSSKGSDYNKIYAILDSNGKELAKFDSGFEYSSVYTGVDGKLYLEVLTSDDESSSNRLELKVFEDGKINNVYSEEEKGYMFTSIVLNNGDLLGYAKKPVDGYVPEDDEKVNSQVYLIENKKKIDCGDYTVEGDKESLPSMINNSSNYIVVSKTTDGTKKYGAIDLKTGKLVLGFDYEQLVTTTDNNFVAVKNKKAALITAKLKKLIDYEYDFIEANDGFYVVGKGKKMALMDKNYKLFTGFDFENALTTEGYDYRVSERGFNSFAAQKYNDKYVLLTKDNANAFTTNDSMNQKNDVYIIGSDGKYTQIKNVSFDINKGLAYSFDEIKKEITVYDENLVEKSKISLKDYDLEDSAVGCLKYEHVVAVTTRYTTLYFDYETGKELDDATYVVTLNNLTINVDLKNQEVTYMNGKDVQDDLTSKLEYDDAFLHYYKDGRFATANNGKLVIAVQSK